VTTFTLPIWPQRFLKVIAERERARATAVRLEQDNAHLTELLAGLGVEPEPW
jgi:hypothetical protein